MGQTLTHGVYLPDEGERNCYSGLAANWQLLDGAVGTIAEHTTQIADRAPLVHTHTKADITDFPAYGNTAGTICEGNDSRLSDARTPVAHTHTKSDVTDLFNSANTWTSDQYFRKTIIVQNSVAVSAGSYDIGINFFDSVGNRYGYIQPYVTSNNQKRLMLGSDTGELSCNSDFIPANNNLNFGNSNLKWKTLNGCNPGALSLPNSPGGTGTENVNYYDLSGNITVRDGSAGNNFTASCDGWIAIGTFASWLQISNNTLQIATTANPGADGFVQAFLPVRKGNAIKILVNQTNTQFQSFKLLPCEGNV